ncbi:hypothetical protein [Cohnella candidum]|uniref:Spore coat protein n=1 Tax=Cohnella candidum TaxID=2674991 RepID=A0A3G3K2D7_9BACL|nr:hypothetical protein [Cohnella candidum]AYQ74540.1 hypothetical protein EAV92_19380 [Cohnella candidum]
MWWKWMNWAAKTLATALLLSFLSIWTTGYIVNSYMESLLKQLDLPLQTQPFALSGVWGRLWGAHPEPTAAADASEKPTPSPASTSPENAGRGGGSGKASPDPSPSASANANTSTSPGTGGIASGSPGPGLPDETPSVSAFSGSTAEMTAEQRQLLRTVMAKMDAEQLALLSDKLADGLTKAEVEEIGKSIKPILTESEYTQMMELLQSRESGTEDTPNPPAGEELAQNP